MSKKRRKVHYKRLVLLVAAICLLICLVWSSIPRMRLWIKGYDFTSQNILLKLNKEEQEKYLALDEAIDIEAWNSVENQQHYIDYVNYQKQTSCTKKQAIAQVDALYDRKEALDSLGYGLQKMMTYSLSGIDFLISKGYTYDQVSPYLTIRNVDLLDMEGYLAYDGDPLMAVLSVTYPMIDSQNAYDTTYRIDDPANLLALIKRGFVVDETYEPSDLVLVNVPWMPEREDIRLRKEAAQALEAMADDAKQAGFSLTINSAYRSYAEQKQVYDEYFQIYDATTAASLVATPGSSEHQLGLSVDLSCQGVIDGQYDVFGQSPDYQWTVEHCHEYGFILRYPKDKTALTGATNEPWHYRYVGKEAAGEMYENQWTLEEYIQHHGFSYDLTKVS